MAVSRRSSEKEAFWRLVVDEQQASGLSVRAFCKRESVSEPSFYSWRRKLRERDACGVDQQGPLIPVAIVDRSDSVQTPPSATQAGMLEVVTPSGFTLRFGGDIEVQRLSTLLNVVSRCPSGAQPC